ncbi:TetR/AcrR family transcriptional regulator [Streptomyces kanamyceticus]|uniref:TetR/AcrR family transcriptional regulator n=1 Tax=Streptomyces kanamyceticus TaxID=1967 RepID=A0A5J6GS40_STRKN|nr:TetR/AcrR family transcriptional regulator [Streptomyces kanamyceticus]
MTQPLRSDALDNRARIVEAARALFSTEGLKVPMREVARRANVGPATLYRHFPAKQALMAAVFADQMCACRAVAEEACADPDPWRGLCRMIEKICATHACDRGFTEAFLTADPLGSADIAQERALIVKALGELAERAKRAGRLRPDFVLDDLFLMLMAHCGIRAASPTGQATASRRFVAYMIQAFEARPGTTPLPPSARPAFPGFDVAAANA